MGIIRVVVFFHNDSTDNQTCRSTFLGVQPLYDINNSADEMEPLNHWSTIECQVAIICACLPTTRAMLVHLFPRMFGVATEQDYSDQPNAYRGGASTSGAGTGYVNDKSQISKTMTVSIDYGIQPQRPQQRRSGSFVQLVEMDSNPQHGAV